MDTSPANEEEKTELPEAPENPKEEILEPQNPPEEKKDEPEILPQPEESFPAETQAPKTIELPEDKQENDEFPLSHSCQDNDLCRPSSPRVVVHLNSQRKSPLNFEIADSLLDRNHQKEMKISNLRLKQKAEELKEVRSVPEINKNYKKSATVKTPKGKNKAGKKITSTAQETDKNKVSEEFSKYKMDFLKKKSHKDEDNEDSSNNQDVLISYVNDRPDSYTVSHYEIMPKRDVIKSDQHKITHPGQMKDTIKLREKLKDKPTENTEKKKLDVFSRAKIMKEKKLKAQKEAEIQRKNKEIEGCTFKPSLITKNQVNDTGSFIIKRSLSGDILKGSKEKPDVQTPQSPRAKLHEIEENFKLTPVSLLPGRYSQVSPISVPVKYKLGYNEKQFLSRAMPMVDYKIVGTEID